MRYLISILLFVSCKNFTKGGDALAQNEPALSSEKLDTVKQSLYSVRAKPEIFETAFFQGTKSKIDTFTCRFYAVDIGKIKIESGKIIACDPIFMSDWEPFSQVFPTGQFPLQLAIAQINRNERISFSRILFSNNPVTKWEFALTSRQKPTSIFTDSIYSYGVDGGLGCFVDEHARNAFDKILKKDDKTFEKVFITEIGKHSHKFGEFLMYSFDNHNFASFSSGLGDGHYATYIGYDDKGQVCRLLTDFRLVPW